MKKTDEAKFYIQDKKKEIIEVYFSREELIKHLSSLVLVYNNDVYLKTETEELQYNE